MEFEQKPAVTSPPQPLSTKVMESDSKAVETEIDGVPMESDKPAQPGVERESTATLTPEQGMYMYIYVEWILLRTP